ncbi:Integrase arm-type DNA-binding domain-containing protein [Hyphomicrobium sp. 1Nfss2.1]
MNACRWQAGDGVGTGVGTAPVGEPGMGRGINHLTARQVQSASAPGKISDGGGLYLFVRKRGQELERLWLFRYKRGERGAERERTLSLGPARDVTLAAARTLAARCREALSRGEDPKRAIETPALARLTFGEVADAYMDAIENSFKSDDTRASWRRTLGDRYCAKLRRRLIGEVSTEDIVEVLKDVWQVKPETARKVRARIETVLDAAKVRGLRTGENPARWRGHLKHLLGKQRAKKGHHRALPYKQMPAFIVALRRLDSVSAMALEWTILTAARTSETILAPRSEVDRDSRVWVVPPERMKEGREHRVPLTPRCIAIYDAMESYPSDWLFPGRNPKEPLSEMAMSMCLRGITPDATVHGFRSTFRDWVGDCTTFPREIAEAALSHLIGDEAEQAYRRSDALERRRKLMLSWEKYCVSRINGSTNQGALRR